MPFRRNFFGTPYAQPGTDFSEIEDLTSQKVGGMPSIAGAIVYEDGDSSFKFGGEIQFEEFDDEYVENLGFDGFESIDAAKDWLINEIGVSASSIEIES